MGVYLRYCDCPTCQRAAPLVEERERIERERIEREHAEQQRLKMDAVYARQRAARAAKEGAS
jgi:hypothetical protein